MFTYGPFALLFMYSAISAWVLLRHRAALKAIGPRLEDLKLRLTLFDHGNPSASATLPQRRMAFPTFSEEIHTLFRFNDDYVRFATLALAIQHVLKENIPGNFGEVGVYRGTVSSIIHKIAPDRTLFLLDTFEGFPREALAAEGFADHHRFEDTSVATVLENIGEDRNVQIIKGRIPDTLKDVEHQRFAFVLLDLDLYTPTKLSLEFFYPRMNSGGYVMIHDYNSPESDWGCHRAVDEFMKDKPEKIVEVPDVSGTCMFRKI